jgi:hypothetical protein
MSYLETLRAEAEKKLKPLAEKVAKLTRHLDGLRKRAESEAGTIRVLENSLAALKSAAGEYLTAGQNDYATYKVRLKRATDSLATAKEAVVLFERELIPAKQRELEAASDQLQKAGQAFYGEHLPACENRMADLLSRVVAERDDFLIACAQLSREYPGANVTGPAPKVVHGRLDAVVRSFLGLPWLTFTHQPAEEQTAALAMLARPPQAAASPPEEAPVDLDAPATMPAACAECKPTPVNSPPAPEVGESVKGDGPKPPEAATGASAPRSAIARRASLLKRCTAPADADLDPDTLPPDLDAEADAEAPPDAGENNLEISADSI